ncbi:hypothetical protein M758_12G183300 [Ceratodon purpureus]|nr:hypothetical protein M758_12G183300 [Ceratodon purpureus]
MRHLLLNPLTLIMTASGMEHQIVENLVNQAAEHRIQKNSNRNAHSLVPVGSSVVALRLLPPELAELAAHDGAPLHARHHHLEPVEVRHRRPPGAHRQLLPPRAARPLLLHLRVLVRLPQHLLGRRARQLRDGDVRQRQPLEVDLRPHHVGRVHERAVLVDDVHNHHQLAVVGPVVHERHPSNLNEATEHHGGSRAMVVQEL